MVEVFVATSIALVLVVGPLAWRVLRDRREETALSTRAYVQSLVDRKLGGESFVFVRVIPRGVWSLGQVVVSVPGGWEWMLDHCHLTAGGARVVMEALAELVARRWPPPRSAPAAR